METRFFFGGVVYFKFTKQKTVGLRAFLLCVLQKNRG